MDLSGYLVGGDLYYQVWDTYGSAAANALAAAAESNDITTFNVLLSQARRGSALTGQQNGGTSTLGNFVDQITTNPLAAPLDSANNVLGNSFLSLLKSPWVILTLGIVVFLLLGGGDFLRRQLAKR